jgi:hypothetical protein
VKDDDARAATHAESHAGAPHARARAGRARARDRHRYRRRQGQRDAAQAASAFGGALLATCDGAAVWFNDCRTLRD